MSRNQVSFDSLARRPRGAVLLNGTAVPWVDWNVDTNAFAEADTAKATLAAALLPAGLSVEAILALTSIEVEIRAGFPANPDQFTAAELDTVFLGHADNVTFDPIQRDLAISCRDFTALMIDTKTTEQYRNQTASEVATTIAGLHGLTPVVTATSARIGTFYQLDHVRVHHARTEWDLLSWLAREEDYVVFVSGRKLHFEPRPSESQDPYLFKIEAGEAGQPLRVNAATLRFERDLALAKGIKVEVRSWHSRGGRVNLGRAGHGGADAQIYRYSIPGLMPAEATARAQAIYNELSQHQVKLSVSGPADNILAITDVIKVEGSPFDQVFYPDTIARRMSVAEGYRWTIEARNRARDDASATTPLDAGAAA